MTKPGLTVQDLLAAKAQSLARKRAEEVAAAAQKREEVEAFTRQVMTYRITEEDKARAILKIRRAFDLGERDVMIVQFPSDVCVDSGRRIHNHLEGWQETLPGALKQVHDWWEQDLAPGGFTFGARVINYPDGMPGDVGIFIGWPEREV
jgi:hypothetical protein